MDGFQRPFNGAAPMSPMQDVFGGQLPTAGDSGGSSDEANWKQVMEGIDALYRAAKLVAPRVFPLDANIGNEIDAMANKLMKRKLTLEDRKKQNDENSAKIRAARIMAQQ